MTTVTIQTLAVSVGGLALLATTVSLTRRGLLSLRYGLGWMAVSLAVVLAALLLWAVAPLANLLRMTPTGLMLAAATSFIVTLTLQLSVSLSGQQSAIRDLTEAIALLESRTQKSETTRAAAPSAVTFVKLNGLQPRSASSPLSERPRRGGPMRVGPD